MQHLLLIECSSMQDLVDPLDSFDSIASIASSYNPTKEQPIIDLTNESNNISASANFSQGQNTSAWNREQTAYVSTLTCLFVTFIIFFMTPSVSKYIFTVIVIKYVETYWLVQRHLYLTPWLVFNLSFSTWYQ